LGGAVGGAGHALAPQIGYATRAELSKQSVKEGVLIRDLVKRENILPPTRWTRCSTFER
jgi:aspartate ammonia-lyase